MKLFVFFWILVKYMFSVEKTMAIISVKKHNITDIENKGKRLVLGGYV